jgi:CheY-like chemotaxis protein
MSELRYLIVDDSPTVRLTIRQALSQEKVNADLVAEAGSAAEAVVQFDRTHPEVVFLDVTLSEGGAGKPVFDVLNPQAAAPKNGNDVARYMRSKDAGVTIVVCTGNAADDPRVREMIKGGAFQLLQKPVRLAQIRQVLLQVRDERESPGAPTA